MYWNEVVFTSTLNLLVCSNYEAPVYTLQSTTTKDDLTTYLAYNIKFDGGWSKVLTSDAKTDTV